MTVIQAQIADRAHVVPAFGKTEKGYLKVGHDATAMQQKYDHNTTTHSDERFTCTGWARTVTRN